jgi:hypothetical protein
MAFASVATVARITIESCSSRRLTPELLMDVESHILNCLLFHGSRSFPAFGVPRLQGGRRERAFNMR